MQGKSKKQKVKSPNTTFSFPLFPFGNEFKNESFHPMISGEPSMTARKSQWTKAAFASLASLFGSSRKKRHFRTRLLIELLENRCVPATITPTTFADGVLGSGSLRDAVLQFNADAGSDDDIILLEPGTYALTIPNIGGHHETAGLTGDLNLTSASHRWILQGAGSSGNNATVIDASQLQDRVLQIVTPGTQVVFRDLVIQGGLAQDDGSDGALAGTTDALGGGILNNGGDVTLDNVLVQNNLARGGDIVVLSAPGHTASGGGIYSTGGALTIAGVTLANNRAIGGRGGDHNGNQYAGTGGTAGGGGLYATGGSLEISDSMIASNQARGGRGGDGSYSTPSGLNNGGVGGMGQGGGLYVNGSSLTLTTSTIASNQGTGGSPGVYGGYGTGLGGGLYKFGTLTVSNSTLAGNSATYGGGTYNSGTLTVSNTTLSGNSGSGIENEIGTLTVSNTTLSGNSGSGIDNHESGTVTVTNSTVSGNTGGRGIYNYSGRLTVSNSTVSGNTIGIYNESGTVTVTNSTVSGNTGGGIDNYSGRLTVSNSIVSGNTGGGIGNISYSSTLTVSNSIVSGISTSYAQGGGIYNGGTLTVSNSTLSGNTAPQGGGVANDGTLTVSNSTLSGNTAISYEGGGIYNYGTLAVSNSTLSDNAAAGDGGAISAQFHVTLTNVTITANRANTGGATSHGGGLFALLAFPVLHNTLIADNFNGATGTTRDDVYGWNLGGDYNLIGDGTGMRGLTNGVNGNLVGSAAAPIDPLLGPLADNGGPTLTHALLAGSPAIDAGNNAYATDWDQRGAGFPRIVNGIIDIGAFEVQADGPVPPDPRRRLGHAPVESTLIPANPLRLDRTVDVSSGRPTDQPLSPSAIPNIPLTQKAQAGPAIATGPNSKSESRNPKQIRSTKSKPEKGGERASDLGISDFEFVSDFDIRASDL
jgi:hypothetical protein